jgi:hypothetical protein
MNGDHNMNQKHMTHEEWMKHDAYRNEMHRNQVKQVDEEEKYKSQIDRQCVEMQCTIDLLKATVETLYMRLKPVMVDAPMRTASSDVSPVASPLGLSINQYRQQTTAVIDELAHIIESLEI